MKMNVMKKILFVAFGALLISCGSDKKPVEKTPETKVEKKVETLSFDKSKVDVKWTAYKFTERVGVSGNFKTVNITDKMYGATIKEALSGLSFSIPVNSVFSKNEIRDKRLAESFFGVMTDSESIKGEINSINGSEEKGMCSVVIQMNGISKVVNMEYHNKGAHYLLRGIIDMNSWQAKKAVESLNKACKDLHKGADGKSVLWPDVKLEISLPYTK
jgi:hypothetical protein